MAIRVTRKINTSAVLARDDDGRELVALGRGIGFIELGAPIDLSRVSQTFYNVDERYLVLLNEIPLEVVEFATQIVQVARGLLSYELTPGIPFVLADHIAFAIKRARQGVVVHMPLSFDVEQRYPIEYRLGELAVKRINEQFSVRLPCREAVGIAMAFLNNIAAPGTSERVERDARLDDVLEQATAAVERCLDVRVDRASFNYSRFATHLQYLYQRVVAGQSIESGNAELYGPLCGQYPDIAHCVDEISGIFARELARELTEEERLYLMLHVNRIAAKAGDAAAAQHDDASARGDASPVQGDSAPGSGGAVPAWEEPPARDAAPSPVDG